MISSALRIRHPFHTCLKRNANQNHLFTATNGFKYGVRKIVNKYNLTWKLSIRLTKLTSIHSITFYGGAYLLKQVGKPHKFLVAWFIPHHTSVTTLWCGLCEQTQDDDYVIEVTHKTLLLRSSIHYTSTSRLRIQMKRGVTRLLEHPG